LTLSKLTTLVLAQDMCSGCREAMRKPKLVTLNDADDRKHGSTGASAPPRQF
jgi:hypothetical protein